MGTPLEQPLEKHLLSELHERFAGLLWDAPDASEAVARSLALAVEMPPVVGDPGEIATAHG